MKSNLTRLFLLLPLLIAWIGACNTYRQEQGPLTEFEFLEGTWARSTPDGINEESWSSNKGWSMRGIGRVLNEGREVYVEKLAIEPRGSGFAYVAELPDAAPVEFKLVDRGSNWLRFENLAHDFPQRIEYRRNGDSLRAEISGVEKGVEQRQVIEFVRVNAR